MIRQILRYMNLYLESLIIILFSITMTLIVFAQVIMRYVFNSAFPWAEEFSRYLFIWIIYLGISYACRDRRHVRINFLLKRFPDKGQRIVILLGDFLFLFYSIVVLIAGIILNANTYQLGQFTATIQISYVFVYLSIVASALLSSVRIIQNMIYKIKNWNIPIEKFKKLSYPLEIENK